MKPTREERLARAKARAARLYLKAEAKLQMTLETNEEIGNDPALLDSYGLWPDAVITHRREWLRALAARYHALSDRLEASPKG